MKFALLIYESPDAFASRKGDGIDALHRRLARLP